MRGLTLNRLLHRVGRRGGSLLVFAFIDYVIGWSLTDSTIRAQTEKVPVYKAALAVMPLQYWGWLWILVGIVCTVQALAIRDQIGFTCAQVIKIAWASTFLASWLIWDIPRGWLGAATWIVLALLVRIIGGWPEATNFQLLPRKEAGG